MIEMAKARAETSCSNGIRFVDVASISGIDFQHVSGSPEKKYILETMSGGVAWIDYDQDGWIDLYLVNGGHWEELIRGRRSVSNALYRNRGDGMFSNVTASAGVKGLHWGMGVTVADYDNDGWPDLYLSNFGPNTLYRNNGDGTFTDVTERAGVGDSRWSVSSAVGDYDADGHLDLYVANTVRFDAHDPGPTGCHYRGITTHCGPLGMIASADVFYRNLGDGSFQEAGRTAGTAVDNSAYGLGVAWSDYDNDGDLDIYVANDRHPNFLFQNQGNGAFLEVGLLSGAAFSEDGLAQGSMGVAFGDYDHDGWFDVFLTHFSDEYNTLYRNLGDGRFRDVSHSTDLAFPSWRWVGWGTAFGDFDHNGWEDLFVVNGHVFPQVDDYEAGTRFNEPSQLFLNFGSGKFKEDPQVFTTGPAVSRGAAFGDFDNDGDIDVAVNNLDGNPWLLRNDGGNKRGSWLQLALTGVRSNRSAVGARLTVESDQGLLIREVSGGSSYQSSNDLRVHFGLGTRESAKSLTVRWTDGSSQTFKNVETRQFYRLTEGGELQ